MSVSNHVERLSEIAYLAMVATQLPRLVSTDPLVPWANQTEQCRMDWRATVLQVLYGFVQEAHASGVDESGAVSMAVDVLTTK